MQLRKTAILALGFFVLFSYIQDSKKANSQTLSDNVSVEQSNSNDNIRWLLVNDVVVREQPNRKAKCIQKLPYGTKIEITGKTGGATTSVRLQCDKVKGKWLEIKLNKGQLGWIHEAFVSRQ